MNTEDIQNTQPDLPFPIRDEHIRKITEKLSGGVVILCDPAWTVSLQQFEGKYRIKVIEWDGSRPEELLADLAIFRSVVFAYPEWEERRMNSIEPLLRQKYPKVRCFRLLRDIILHMTIQTGGEFLPVEGLKAYGPGNPAYFIFAIPRTGSTFFSDILLKTRMLGFPREHLLIDLMPVLCTTDLTFNVWLRALVNHACTSNGYASTKIISHLFLDLLENYHDRPELVEDLEDFIRQYPVIYIKRKNLLRQAISLVRANKSSVWHVRNGRRIVSADKDDSEADMPEAYNNAMIYLFHQEEKMEAFFEKAGIVPKVYYYEDFSDQSKRDDIFREVMSSLDMDYNGKVPETGYAVLSDEENERIVKEYYGHLEKLLEKSGYPSGPLAKCIISSLSAELAYPHQQFRSSRKSGNTRRWRLF